MDIVGSLLGMLGEQNDNLAQQTGMSNEQTNTAVAILTPLLMKQLARNAATPEGEQSLQSALSQKHDGSILNDLMNAISSPDKSDGQAIIGHILGDNQANVVKKVSKKTGANQSQIITLLAILAPIVMGMLGKQTQTPQTTQSKNSGLGTLLGGLLDQNQDGSIVDDLLRTGLGMLTQKK